MRRRPIIMYHSVDTQPDPVSIQVTPGRLRQQLRVLQGLGLHGVSMRELLEEHTSRARLVGLTFDDGYADFATTAVPVLADFGFSSTVFMVAGHLGGDNDWDPPPRRPLMTAEQLRAVEDAGHEIGSHGMRHVRLVGLPPQALAHELKESKTVLERVARAPVTGFCYPYGALDCESVAAVRSEYDYACAVDARTPVNQWAIPRFHVGEADRRFRMAVKLTVRPFRERLQRRAP